MYPCFYSNHWFSEELAAFGAVRMGVAFLRAFQLMCFILSCLVN